MSQYLLGVALLILIAFIIYARYIEPYQLVVKKVNVSDKQHVKIMHLADIHFGVNFNIEQLRKLVTKINSIDKDLIVFTGDFFDDRFNGDIDEIVEVLLSLDSNIAKYAIWGNHDYKHHALEVYEQVMERSGFVLLKNEREYFSIRDKHICITGSDDYLKGNFDKSFLENVEQHNYNILLLHEPDVVDFFDYKNYDLILSGHSHGGQVVLPLGIKGLTRLGRKYQDGLFVLSYRSCLYVSSGLGTSGTRLRFRVKPSISVISI